ncbi:SfnB family sulfur acquisition oxidoreductase [Conexibacter sp. W3-3-2]|nr:SfnB family sulfur acquisition oxidoreductase [Conexibacter sp. W3-3-2]
MADEPAVLAAADALAAELATGAAERDRSGEVPRAALAALDASGLLAITVPREHGGIGGGPVLLAEVVRRLAVADPAVAQGPQAHFLFVDVLAAIGTDEQRRRLFADVLAGRRIGNALAERGVAHAQDLKTRLRADGADGYRLTGTKGYATGALTAAWIAISALDEDDRLRMALVPRETPGVTLDEVWHAMGQRATVSGGVVLDDVAVPATKVLDYAALFAAPQVVGARAQLVHAAIEVGIARAAVDDAAWFLREKARPFSEAVARGLVTRASDDPYALHRLGEHGARASAAEALLERAARRLQEIPLRPADDTTAAVGSLAVAEVKAFASEAAVQAANDLFAIGGTSATDRRLGLDRHWRNARTHSVHDPVAWKYHHLGGYLVDGRVPPNHGQI